MSEDNQPTQKTPEGDERDELGLPGEGGNEIPVPTQGGSLSADLGEGCTTEARSNAPRLTALAFGA